jgi:hypothetical protein
MYFPNELWDEIKCYAGIYSITTNWDLMKLSKEELIKIIKNNINNNIEYEDTFLKIKKNMGSIKKYLIQYFWKNINNSKLLEIYRKYTCQYCPYDYTLYNYNDVYLLSNYKRKVSFTFSDKITYNTIFVDRPFEVINITKKYLELISLNEDNSEEPQKIKIKRNIYGVEKLLYTNK